MSPRDSLERDNIPRWVIMLVGFVLVGLLGVLDYYTGRDLVLASLYIIPIALVTWYAGLAAGLSTAVISTGVMLTAEVASGEYPRPLILVLNYAIRLAFFLLVVWWLLALRKAMRRFRESTRVDNLTGAANSASFYDVLAKELDRLARYGHPLTLAYLDLDGFKEVNDGFGHLVGDRVLRVVVDCAKSRLRKTDMVARMGGDEFAVLCPETDEESARAALAEVLVRLDEEMQTGGWPVTFSVGVVTCHEVPPTSEELVKMADDLMYSVKLGTKNAVKFASLGCARSESPLCDERTLVDARR